MSATPEDLRSRLSLLKGTTDQPPEAQIRRQAVMATIREAFELFGFGPLETPILSRFETLSLKYLPGDPILEEIFHATDRGKRELGLRYDLTIPFCRFLAQALQGNFALPFKRYEMGKVFRDGPIREGRLREFIQCDADVVGLADPAADAECLALADFVFDRLGVPVEIELNDRKILWAILLESGLDEEKRDAATTAVDKWDKAGPDAVASELRGLGLQPSQIERIFALLAPGDGGEATLAGLDAELESEQGRKGLADLRAVIEAFRDFGTTAPLKVTPRLARGLGIYTGTIFEFFCRDRSLMDSAIGAGGRYDRIVGEFLHPDEPGRHADYPGVGLTFGIEPICVALGKLQTGSAPRPSVVEVLIVPMNARREALRLAGELRRHGARAEVELAGGRLKKAFRRADSLKIPYLVLLGEDELAAGEVALRDMESGEQVRIAMDRAAEEIATRCVARRG